MGVVNACDPLCGATPIDASSSCGCVRGVGNAGIAKVCTGAGGLAKGCASFCNGGTEGVSNACNSFFSGDGIAAIGGGDPGGGAGAKKAPTTRKTPSPSETWKLAKPSLSKSPKASRKPVSSPVMKPPKGSGRLANPSPSTTELSQARLCACSRQGVKKRVAHMALWSAPSPPPKHAPSCVRSCAG